jgi:exosome complex component RRP41
MIKKYTREDERSPESIRVPKYQTGIVPNVEGSALVKAGFNHILVTVRGPRLAERWNKNHAGARVVCRYTMAPFSVSDRKRPGYDRRSQEIAHMLGRAAEGAIDIAKYPGCEIHVNVDVLSCDGSTRVTALGAICLALIDAGIEIKGLFAGCSVGRYEDQMMTDLTGLEDNHGDLDIAIGGCRDHPDLLLFQSDGKITEQELDDAMRMGMSGLEQIFQEQEKHLRGFHERGRR